MSRESTASFVSESGKKVEKEDSFIKRFLTYTDFVCHLYRENEWLKKFAVQNSMTELEKEWFHCWIKSEDYSREEAKLWLDSQRKQEEELEKNH